MREIKSGENKTGVLLEIREKLFVLGQQKKRETRFKRVLEEKRAAAHYGGDSNAVVNILADDDDSSLEIFKV